jgi:hypothetical protein
VLSRSFFHNERLTLEALILPNISVVSLCTYLGLTYRIHKERRLCEMLGCRGRVFELFVILGWGAV